MIRIRPHCEAAALLPGWRYRACVLHAAQTVFAYGCRQKKDTAGGLRRDNDQAVTARSRLSPAPLSPTAGKAR